MLSEWEVSFLGFKKRVLSALEEAELRLRRTHAGPVEGCWGGCSIEPAGDGVLASLGTALAPAAPRETPPVVNSSAPSPG